MATRLICCVMYMRVVRTGTGVANGLVEGSVVMTKRGGMPKEKLRSAEIQVPLRRTRPRHCSTYFFSTSLSTWQAMD